MIMINKKNNLKGFKTMWIRFNEETTDKHQIFFKEHSIRNQEPEHPRGRTLFMLNIPPYVTSENLKRIFGDLCGIVSNVYFIISKGFKTAYIIFENESDLEKALEISDDYIVTLNDGNNFCLTGIRKWCIEYNRSVCNEKKMKEEIETYMQNYDKKIAEKIIKEKMMEEEVQNNDGWVTVTGRKKRGQFALSRKESTINKVQHKEVQNNDGWVTVTGRKKRGQFALSRKESTINKVQHKEEQKNKKKQLLNFYTFQIRESKKQNLAELRKKFELDKKRLQDLKLKRTFKPF